MSLVLGTSRSRCKLFDRRGQIVAAVERGHRQVLPAPGRVEHDPAELWANIAAIIPQTIAGAGIDARQVVSMGIANQREAIIVWDRRTGETVGNAIGWADTRAGGLLAQRAGSGLRELVRRRCGLPLSPYFSASRIAWVMEQHPQLRDAAEQGLVLAGTLDSWLLWRLTGGPQGGVHATDVTNASRTMLMNLETLDWDAELLREFDIPAAMLPRILASTGHFGTERGTGIPITALLGDQQAALFGQACFGAGEAKCTYGTGAALLMNTGRVAVRSDHGLLTTVAYQIEGQPVHYALEGSIGPAGGLVDWIRQMGMIDSPPAIETLAGSVPDSADCHVIPGFAGLFAPHWESSARGAIVGLTGYVTKAHLARAVLEAIAWQTKSVVDAVDADFQPEIETLRIDGAMAANNLLMQLVADALERPVVRPSVSASISRGAAYAAGLSATYWSDPKALHRNIKPAGRWEPTPATSARADTYRTWQAMVAMLSKDPHQLAENVVET
ncbi:FGGY family carbohydrate kinase [Nocardia sp. NPDC020380]|uniref:FGGY family carbohydrate kinase n=1 Tax=Nocardia sp. NPDC020380 TaxID=3364309 RepID=UPI0037A0A212